MTQRRLRPGGDEGRAPLLSLRDLAVAALLLAAVGGVAFWKLDRSSPCEARGYVNPGVACTRETAITADTYARLENEVRTFIAESRADGKVERASVVVRALRDGPTLSVDEYDTFAPASLLKLPLVLAFFRFEEDDPGFLRRLLPYARSEVSHFEIPDQIEAPRGGLREGRSYSIEELMLNTIVHSDNLAYYLLLEHGNFVVPEGKERIHRTFQEIGILDPKTFTDETVSARGYANVFQALYNASFLNVRESEKVLSWLVQSHFDKGIVAGVPADVPVGNKFGERVLPDGTKQLHDCGIVFFPDNPYSVCVMTQGADFDELRAVIRQISRMVYDETDAHAGLRAVRAAGVGLHEPSLALREEAADGAV